MNSPVSASASIRNWKSSTSPGRMTAEQQRHDEAELHQQRRPHGAGHAVAHRDPDLRQEQEVEELELVADAGREDQHQRGADRDDLRRRPPPATRRATAARGAGRDEEHRRGHDDADQVADPELGGAAGDEFERNGAGDREQADARSAMSSVPTMVVVTNTVTSRSVARSRPKRSRRSEQRGDAGVAERDDRRGAGQHRPLHRTAADQDLRQESGDEEPRRMPQPVAQQQEQREAGRRIPRRDAERARAGRRG